MRRVVHIAVCGQMHGAVFWRQGDGWTRNSRDQVEVGYPGPKVPVRVFRDQAGGWRIQGVGTGGVYKQYLYGCKSRYTDSRCGKSIQGPGIQDYRGQLEAGGL